MVTYVSTALCMFRWESIGFGKMIKEWKSNEVDLRETDAVEVPADAVIFRVPVDPEWGIK